MLVSADERNVDEDVARAAAAAALGPPPPRTEAPAEAPRHGDHPWAGPTGRVPGPA